MELGHPAVPGKHQGSLNIDEETQRPNRKSVKRILVTGAGGSPAANFIRSLRKAPEEFYITGTDADKYYLMRGEVDTRYLVPRAEDPLFLEVLNAIIAEQKIGFVHAQNDPEVRFLSEQREKVQAQTFLPLAAR